MTAEFKTFYEVLKALNTIKSARCYADTHSEKFTRKEQFILKSLDDVVDQAFSDIEPCIVERMKNYEHIKG